MAPWKRWPDPTNGAERAERCIQWITEYVVIPKGAGAGQLAKLAPFQREWIRASLADGVSASVLSMGAGNGKSTLVYLVALWRIFDPCWDGYPEIPVVSTRVDQAVRTMIRPMKRAIQASPELKYRAKIRDGVGGGAAIEVPATGAVAYPVADAVDGLQGLDFSMAVCDELGFIGAESWGALLGRLGKQPGMLVLGMGTVGYSKEGRALHAVLSAMERGDLDEHVVVHMYSAPEGCGLWDEDAWISANPGIEAGILELEPALTAARLMSETEVRVTRLNQYADAMDSWLGEDGGTVWRSLATEEVLHEGAPTWIGLDIGISFDSAAVAIVQEMEDGRLIVTGETWLPTKDRKVDRWEVVDYLRAQAAAFDLQAVAFDPRLFDVHASILEAEGLPMVEISQQPERMTPVIGSAYERVTRTGTVLHHVSPEFTRQVLSAVPAFQPRGGFTLKKRDSKVARYRIDAAVALSLAIDQHDRPRRRTAPLAVIVGDEA